MPPPTFLLIGAAKAGTTAVHAWLAQHPQVCMSRPKETEHFSVHFGDSSYESPFSHWNGEPAVGESTPMYLTLPYVPRRIAATLPDVRLVAILRDPAEQAFSAWWMMRSLGVEPRTFEEAVNDALHQGPVSDGEAERAWKAIVRGDSPVDVTYYLLMGRYRESVERYRALFGEEALTVFLYEDLVQAPEKVARELCQTIDVDHGLAPSPVPAGRNRATGRAEALARRTLPTAVPARARRAVYRGAGLLDRQGAPRLDPAMRARLVPYFAEANEGLGALLGADLSAWETP